MIMKNNIFLFGDSHWLQLKGTSMVTPPAPKYPTVIYSVYELFLHDIFVISNFCTEDSYSMYWVIWKEYNEELNAEE